MIPGEPTALRGNELRASGTEAAWIKRWKDGGKQKGTGGGGAVLWRPGLRVFPW